MKWTHIVIGVLVFTSSAFAQWQPPRTPDGQPDMQGIWRNGTALTGAAMLSLEGDHSRWPEEFVIPDLTGLSGIPDLPPLTSTYIIDPPNGKISVSALGSGETAGVYRQHVEPDEAGTC